MSYTIYKYHNCDTKHRSFRTVAKCIWGESFQEIIDTPWIALLPGGQAIMCMSEQDAVSKGGRVIRIADNPLPNSYRRGFAPQPIVVNVSPENQNAHPNNSSLTPLIMVGVVLVMIVLCALVGALA